MNEFDHYVKHTLKTKYYIRYADDFVFFSDMEIDLSKILQLTGVFLRETLNLELHPNKVFITAIYAGIDFLGWVHFSHHRVLRTSTKRRMLKRITELPQDHPTVVSYTGLLNYGNCYKLKEKALLFIKYKPKPNADLS